MSQTPDANIITLVAAVSRIESKLEIIDKGVNGNGQPGLVQKVEALEEHQNKITGGLAVIALLGAGLWGFLEWAFHVKGGSGH